MVPDGWKLTAIGDFLFESRQSGSNGASAKRLTVKLYGLGVIPKSESRPGSENTKYYIRRSGQFIYSKLDFLNGAFGIVPPHLDGYESTLDLPAFDFSPKVNPRWFLHFVSRKVFYESQLGLARGGRKAKRVNPEDFLAVKIPMPERIEQDSIVERLSAIDNAIEKTKAVIEQTKRLKQGLLQELLTRGFGHTKFKMTEIGEIPESWRFESLDRVAERKSGHTPSKTHPEYWSGDIKWVSLADSSRLDKVYVSDTDKKISDLGLKNSSAVLLPRGTVILSRDAGVGKSAIISEEMAVSQHFMAWTCGDQLHNLYLYYVLQYYKPIFERVAIGSTIKTIGLSFFKKLHIPLPITQEQIRIANVLFAHDSLIKKSEFELTILKAIKSKVASELLTGMVIVYERS